MCVHSIVSIDSLYINASIYVSIRTNFPNNSPDTCRPFGRSGKKSRNHPVQLTVFHR